MLINWTGWWHLTSVWMPRTWLETCHLWTFVALQYKFLRPLPAVKHFAYVTFIKKFCWNFERCICIISGSQCMKPHTSCILELVPKPFFETDNYHIWFQSRDKNFHCLELSIRWIARCGTPPFLSNYSCPFIQLIIFLVSIVYPGIVNGLVRVACYVSFIQPHIASSPDWSSCPPETWMFAGVSTVPVIERLCK